MKYAEQNDLREKSKVKVSNKLLTNRSMRRAAKRDPEHAPTKARFRGYSS